VILVEAIKLLGGLSGIASAAFLIYDRFFHDRPLVYLLHEQRFVHLVMSNSSLETIIIENIEITPPGILRVAWGQKDHCLRTKRWNCWPLLMRLRVHKTAQLSSSLWKRNGQWCLSTIRLKTSKSRLNYTGGILDIRSQSGRGFL
jgi:hypothetical protein